MNSDDLENQGPGPVDGSEAKAPPIVLSNNPDSQFLKAQLAEGLTLDQATEKLHEWRANNKKNQQISEDTNDVTPLETRVIRVSDQKHSRWDAILDLMRQRLDENGSTPSQMELAIALNKSQGWVSQQVIRMQVQGVLKKNKNGRGYVIIGDVKRNIPKMPTVFVEIFGEDLKVPLPQHWIQQPCFLFKPDNLMESVTEVGITPGCWVLVQKQPVAEEMDIVAHYDADWGLRLMEYGPAVMGQIEGKVIMILKDRK